MTKDKVRNVMLAVMAGALTLATAQAQTAQNGQGEQNQQTQPKQSQNQDNTGVSTPPPDSTIQADELPPTATPTPAPKPSPGVPANAPAATQPNTAPAPANAAAPAQPAAQPVDPGDDIVSGPAPATAAPANTAGTKEDDNNPDDYGIVTSVPPPNATPTAPGSWNANNDIVNSVPVDPNALAQGTNITVRLKQDLSTSSTQPGTTFTADVTQNVYNGSQLVIPAGSEMRGRVVHVSQGHHLVRRAEIRLRPDMIVLPDGTAYHLYAVAVESMAASTDVNDEGAIVAGHHYVKDAVEYGAGAGTGAAAGGVIAGPVGAGAGAVVGTGLVGTHMLMQPPSPADLPEGSVLIFSLTEPMPLTPTKN